MLVAIWGTGLLATTTDVVPVEVAAAKSWLVLDAPDELIAEVLVDVSVGVDVARESVELAVSEVVVDRAMEEVVTESVVEVVGFVLVELVLTGELLAVCKSGVVVAAGGDVFAVTERSTGEEVVEAVESVELATAPVVDAVSARIIPAALKKAQSAMMATHTTQPARMWRRRVCITTSSV